MTIPVLIAPAYNRHDLLIRMFRSIDHPVERALVVDNGMNIVELDFGYQAGVFDTVTIFRPPFQSLGYGGTINFGISQTADAPWWMWVSNDVYFEPGALADIVRRMEEADGEPIVLTGGFTWGAINRAAFHKIGLVDEWSFFPIYFDDNDYHYRAFLAGVQWVELAGWGHGAGNDKGSMTIGSDERLRDQNHDTFRENQRRYEAKWGGPPGDEVFLTPWNDGGDVWLMRPDISGRADRTWKRR